MINKRNERRKKKNGISVQVRNNRHQQCNEQNATMKKNYYTYVYC